MDGGRHPGDGERVLIPRSIWADIEDVVARAAAAERLVVLSDYDGTLAPIAVTPDEARADPGALEALRLLSRARSTTVAILSGRPAAEVVERVPFAHYVAGLHGAQLRGPGVGGPDLAQARREVEVLRERAAPLTQVPGVLLENKGAALALHTRLCEPGDAARAQALFEAAVVGLEHLELVRGKAVLEARPRGLTKAVAAFAILEALRARDPLVVCLGDDVTDEDAFRALPAPAITLLVADAPRPTAARFWLRGISDVARFLSRLAEVRQAA